MLKFFVFIAPGKQSASSNIKRTANLFNGFAQLAQFYDLLTELGTVLRWAPSADLSFSHFFSFFSAAFLTA